ncbi:MAG: tRNA (adenosine(37)-N6)-dimethylallyltransferase MiaA [Candidatus Portnoybacteria bacterium]|nr:tRNA (adenosine(37)-N6)-dimethylallyltransferase MiaA [Candidatus Portnoybacteria bacterium]MDD4982922.1 tRNA (adenosine(37)-N6)-dimethylallyltransferase MiaA [Candidatus Portnoybacteria bacterium]
MSKPTYPQKPIIVVVGPTASGKSDLAVKLAKKFNGEVISADSRQVYKGMDIGTGKVPLSSPPLAQRGARGVKPAGYYGGIAHYLIDVASPSRRFTAGQYKKLGQAAIKKIQDKNKIPIVCGGTGFYIRMLVDDLQVPAVKPDLKLRAKLEKKTTQELFAELKKLDPRRAAEIDRANPRRLVRALEIIYLTGKPVPPPPPSVIPGLTRNPEPGSRIKCGMTNNNVLFLGIRLPRPKLAKRIKARLAKRLKQGMLAEVKKLRAQGVSWKRLDSFGLEYRWLAKFLQNKISYEEMVERLQKDIEHYAKRQMTWFGRDERIRWIKNSAQAEKFMAKFLKKSAL